MANNEVNLDIKAHGLDELFDKTHRAKEGAEDLLDIVDKIDETTEDLSEEQIELVSDEQRERLRQIKIELEEIRNLKIQLQSTPLFSEIRAGLEKGDQKLLKELAEMEVEEKYGSPKTQRQKKLKPGYEAVERYYTQVQGTEEILLSEMYALEGDMIEAQRLEKEGQGIHNYSVNQLRTQRSGIEREKRLTEMEITEAPSKEELRAEREYKREYRRRQKEKEEDERRELREQQKEQKEEQKRQQEEQREEKNLVSNIQRLTSGALGMIGQATGTSGIASVGASVLGAGSIGLGLGVGSIAAIGLLAGSIAREIHGGRETVAHFAGLTHQISAITGQSEGHIALQDTGDTYDKLSVFGIGPAERANYHLQMARSYGSGGADLAYLSTVHYALTAGIDPSTAITQMANMRRFGHLSGEDTLGFLQRVERLRGMGNIGGRSEIAMENIATMVQAQASISGVMPTASNIDRMMESYAGMAMTGESGAMMGGQFLAGFSGKVAGAGGGTNAFLLRAFLADPSVQSHTMEEFLYWKENISNNQRFAHIMEYARTEFGDLAPVTLANMGLMTVTEYRAYKDGVPVEVGKGNIVSNKLLLSQGAMRTNIEATEYERKQIYQGHKMDEWDIIQAAIEASRMVTGFFINQYKGREQLVEGVDPDQPFVGASVDRGYTFMGIENPSKRNRVIIETARRRADEALKFDKGTPIVMKVDVTERAAKLIDIQFYDTAPTQPRLVLSERSLREDSIYPPVSN